MAMSNYCMFDRLPAELLHTLFNYFSASELFVTFYNVNNYVTATLESYSAYQLDWRAISPSHFRCICDNVRPEQVISLTLSDGDRTPSQSEVFFRRFQIEQFTRLRSLTLLEIEFDSLRSIFTHLPQLRELRSFTFDAYSIRHTYGSLDLNSHNKLEQINTLLRDVYAQLFPRLYFLSLNGGWVLESIPLPNLLHLKLERCPINKLTIITDLAPKLKSLDISVIFGQTLVEDHLLLSQLTRLRLKILNIPVSIAYISWLLSSCLHLKHLELHLRGSDKLANGDEWQSLTKSLMTFNFKFQIYLLKIQDVLPTFRTPFWLEEKRWFVAYHYQYLFTVPYFAPEQVSNIYESPVHFTSPDTQIFYPNVTNLIIDDAENPLKRFAHTILQLQLFRKIDFHKIKSFSISSFDDLLRFTPIEDKMSLLSQLTIRNAIEIKRLQESTKNSYKQIRTLEIGTSLQGHDGPINRLFRLFPHTKHFIYKPDIQSIDLMTHFINGFDRLSSASFVSLGPLCHQDVKYRLNPDLLLSAVGRLTNSISMCRIYHLSSSTSSFGIYWWIED